MINSERCPECNREWVHIRDGIYGCLYMAGHQDRQIVYKLNVSQTSTTDILKVDVPKKPYHVRSKGPKNNLKPKQKRRILMFLAARDGSWCCWYCGVLLTPIIDVNIPIRMNDPLKPTIDHVIPFSRGGTNDDYNLRISCGPCNNDKGDTL